MLNNKHIANKYGLNYLKHDNLFSSYIENLG
jgi:hypothetical protein